MATTRNYYEDQEAEQVMQLGSTVVGNVDDDHRRSPNESWDTCEWNGLAVPTLGVSVERPPLGDAEGFTVAPTSLITTLDVQLVEVAIFRRSSGWTAAKLGHGQARLGQDW